MPQRTTKVLRQRVEEQWEQQGFSCDLWVETAGSALTDFVHDLEQRILLIDGTLVVEMHDRVMRLDPGDEVRIPAGVRHTLRNVHDGTTRWLYGYRT